MINVCTKMSNRKTKGKGTFQRSVKCVAVWVVWLKKGKTIFLKLCFGKLLEEWNILIYGLTP